MTTDQFIVYLRESLHNVNSMSYYRQTERVFCYELYHQMKMLKDYPNSDYYEEFQDDETANLVISSEIAKDAINGYPDFVFHNDTEHNNNDLSKQFAAIEVKLAGCPSNALKKDIIKLSQMVRGPLQYQMGVLIYIGLDLNAFILKVNNILEDQEIQEIYNEQQISQNIFFIFKNYQSNLITTMRVFNNQLDVLPN